MYPNKNKNIPFVPYSPTPDDLAVACDTFVEVNNKLNGGTTEVDFGVRLAEDILLETAMNLELETVPDIEDEGELWKLYEQRVKLGAQAVKKCVDCPLYPSCSGASQLRLEAGIVEPEQLERRKTLAILAREITGDFDVVLKGGFAMILHGINRDTDDIDLDTSKPLKDLEKAKIAKIISDNTQAGENPEPVHNTDDMVRWKIHKAKVNDKTESVTEGDDKPLKVEIKTLKSQYNDSEVTTIDGIRVYTPPALLRKKLRTYQDRDKGRDIIDVSYLLSHFPETIGTIDSKLLEKVLLKLESNPGKDKDTIGLGDLQVESVKATLPDWLKDEKVLVKLLTETRDKIKNELEKRTSSN